MQLNIGILDNLIPPLETLFTLSWGGKGYINIEIDFLVINTILFMDLIMIIKDILLYDSGYNRYIICRED